MDHVHLALYDCLKLLVKEYRVLRNNWRTHSSCAYFLRKKCNEQEVFEMALTMKADRLVSIIETANLMRRNKKVYGKGLTA